MKRGRTYDWIPLWRQKWLSGSTRFELDPAERSVFVDLLCMGGDDDGYIRANEDMPYPREYLSATLVVPLDVINSAIEKCVKYGKIKILPNGSMYILSWDDPEYRFSLRHKRRIMSGNADMVVRVPRRHVPIPGVDINTDINTDIDINIKSCLSESPKSEIDKLFKEFWEAYPRDGREAKVEARKKFGARVKEGNLKKIILALNNYNDFLRYEKNVNHFERRAMGAKTFLHERWKEFVGLKIEPPL